MTRVVQTAVGLLFTSELLASLPGVIHGFGVRGSDLGDYLRALGVADPLIAQTNQIHGNRVHILRASQEGEPVEADVFIAEEPGAVCFVRSADCVPILIAEGSGRAVGAVHAGWRGTALDVAGEALRRMREAFGIDPGDCVASIGPRICGACYEVGVEVVQALSAVGLGERWRAGERNVDLGAANRELLLRAGVPGDRIEVLPQCTCCDRRFTSWRRDRSESERQFNFIVK